MDMNRTEFLQQQNKMFEKLYQDGANSYWMMATTGEEEWTKKAEEAEIAMVQYFSRSDLFEQVKQYRNEDGLDPVEKRELNFLYNNFAGNQLPAELLTEMVKLSTELNSTFNTYRAKLDGAEVSENDIRDILVNSNDLEKRERAWHASKEIGQEVVEKLLDLVKKRNEGAQSLGYKNHHEMAFELQELDRDFVFATFQKLKELTDEPFRQMKREMDEELAARFGIAVGDLRPWHYADPFFQEVPPSKDLDIEPFYIGKDIEQITIDTFSSMGMDIQDMLAKSDLYPRDKKNQHAFCIDIDRKNDVRVLCNNTPSSYWMETMLHEFGHAVYFKYLDSALPYILREPAHTFTTEAIAFYYMRMGKQALWLERFLGLDAATIQEIAPKLEKELQLQMLIAVRWITTFVFFERELYENPDQDLNRLWWKLVEEIQFVNPPENRDYPHWAAKIHFTIAPVYYQNYLLGELTASQLYRYIEENISKDPYKTEVGEFLKDFFFMAARYNWNEKLERTTGEILNPQHFIDRFVK